MTTGAAPVAAVVSSIADATWEVTRPRCCLKSRPPENSHVIGCASPPRRRTASPAYISNGTSALLFPPGARIADRLVRNRCMRPILRLTGELKAG
jgi:hypothetical protein